MILTDSHIHSNKSVDADSNATISSIYSTALRRGLKQIILCDHYDVNAVAAGENPDIDFNDSRRQINQAINSETRFLLGIELGQPHQVPEMADKVLASCDFDFILLSLHNVTNEQDFYFIDYRNITFKRLIGIWERYLEELCVLAEYMPFHSLAHITYPLRYFSNNNILINIDKYADAFIKLYKIIINRGVALEVNTSGLRKRINATSPSFDLLRLYRECGGELLTIGSDAHNCIDIGAGISYTYEKLSSIGFRYVCGIKDKKLNPLPIK